MRGSSRLIVMRRSATDVFRNILASRERWPTGTALMYDRRQRERRVLTQRVALERRKHHRRAEPQEMWYTHGFMVVEAAGLPVQAILLDEPPSSAPGRGQAG